MDNNGDMLLLEDEQNLISDLNIELKWINKSWINIYLHEHYIYIYIYYFFKNKIK